MVKLTDLPTDATPTPISEQEESTLEDQLDAAMEQPVAEGLVVADVELEPVADTPPPVAEAACEETGKGEEPAEDPVLKSGGWTSKSLETEPPTHEESIECATRGVAEAALNQAKAQKATKLAKKEFDYSVEYLQDLVDKGPEVYPLFDDQKSDQEEVEVIEYDPPLEKGQVRVRIIEMVVVMGGPPNQPVAGDLLICRHDPDGVLVWTDIQGAATYFVEEDRYEVLEDWPKELLGSELHVPPLQFGPSAAEAVADALEAQDAWRHVLVSEALPNLSAGRLALLHTEAAIMGDLEDFRAAIADGKAKWPKGIGPAAVTSIEEMILNWLRDNQ